ncbi:MAG TPA: hypothetical protein VGM91_12160 [Conexibacter sp.]
MHQLLAPPEPPPQHPATLVGHHTDSNSPDHNNRARLRASSRSVFARAA